MCFVEGQQRKDGFKLMLALTGDAIVSVIVGNISISSNFEVFTKLAFSFSQLI